MISKQKYKKSHGRRLGERNLRQNGQHVTFTKTITITI